MHGFIISNILQISIHALRVEGDDRAQMARLIDNIISIHALRVEGDTMSVLHIVLHFDISIHALRVEGDFRSGAGCLRQPNFYPRPPGGGRHGHIQLYARAHRFLSTPSGWRATDILCGVFLVS